VTVNSPPARPVALPAGRTVRRSAFQPDDADGVPSSSREVFG
jgi:hypothetical protein